MIGKMQKQMRKKMQKKGWRRLSIEKREKEAEREGNRKLVIL